MATVHPAFAVIASGRPHDMGNEDEHEEDDAMGDDDEKAKTAMGELMSAFKSGDEERALRCFKALHGLVCNAEHEEEEEPEGEEPEDESEKFR